MNSHLYSRRQTVGILGGMGPLATTDLMIKIIEETQADCDQDHVPVVVTSLPQMPSRIDAIRANGPTPLPAMRDALRRLECAGAEVIAMPCNTAHFWHEDLCRTTRLPFLHIVDSAVASLDDQHRRIGVLASSATVQAGIYSKRLRAIGRKVIEPAPELQLLRVDAAIAAVKAGRIGKAQALLEPIAQRLLDAGADAIILGCTEFPIAMRDASWHSAVPLIDATRALARACVAASSPILLMPRQTAAAQPDLRTSSDSTAASISAASTTVTSHTSPVARAPAAAIRPASVALLGESASAASPSPLRRPPTGRSASPSASA